MNTVASASNLQTHSQTQVTQVAQQQTSQQPVSNQHSPSLLPIVPCSFSLNTIRKRKIKFTIQLNIEELLSVPYLNGVLFCKVRLCDGGNHVSYSSKKEVNNSKVLWSNDATIQFDVKAIQLYSTTTLSSTSSSTPNSSPGQTSPCAINHYIIGYEPCLCRISVRKELRGGKSYQKLGYVDYNLADYILKSQQEQNEFCVNRILKEYDMTSKKNQQRLDNSYLKIRIRVLDQMTQLTQSKLIVPKLILNKNQSEASSTSSSDSSSPVSMQPTVESKQNTTNNLSPILKANTEHSTSLTETGINPKIPTHTRNLSLTSNIGLLTNTSTTSSYGHNRSCSNGSIKSNFSFDFIIKNRNNKLIEDIQSTSSTSSFVTSGLIHSSNNFNLKTAISSLSNSSSFQSAQGKNSSSFIHSSSSTSSIPVVQGSENNTNTSLTINNNSSAGSNRLEQPANLRIIETRIDANEIISEIENELANKLNTNPNLN